MANRNGLQPEPPFLVRLFYNSGSLIHPENFIDTSSLKGIDIYTWPSCTLQELVYELADAHPNPLPSPSIGTKLVFQLVYPDLRSASSMGNGRPNFAVKDLGSIVVGAGGPGAEDDMDDACRSGKGNIWTLRNAHFAAGDYISCAILAPLPDGTIAPAHVATKPQELLPRQPSLNRPAVSSRRSNFQQSAQKDGPRIPRGDWRIGNHPPHRPSRGRIRGRGQGRW